MNAPLLDKVRSRGFPVFKAGRWTWFIIGLAVVGLLFGFPLVTGSSAQSLDQYQTEEVGRGTLMATVGATGTVRARQSVVLYWQTGGTVEVVNVEVGDRVRAAEVLAGLSKTSLPQNVILAEAELVSAQRALEDLLESDTARAQALISLDEAEEAYEDALDYRESLNEKITIEEVRIVKEYVPGVGVVSVPKVKTYKGYADEETIADADARLALAAAQLEDAQRAYDRLKDGPDPGDIAAAQARVDAAQATLNLAQVIAPFGGTITEAKPLRGDQVTSGTPAFRVDDLSTLLVDVEVSEVDINSIAAGQPATLTFDAILGKEYHGVVTQVGQVGNIVQGVVSFNATVELTDADEQVKPGMTAAVTILVNELKDVLLVPNRAVRVVDGDRVVYTLQDGKPFKVEIRLGASSETMSVVVGGDLQQGDVIILNPPADFSTGDGPPPFVRGR